MPQSNFPFIDLGSGKPVASSTVFPDSHTVLASEKRAWNGRVLVEERHHLLPLETSEFVTTSPRVHLSLDYWESLETASVGKWQRTAIVPSQAMIVPARMPLCFRWRQAGLRVLEICLASSLLTDSAHEATDMDLTYHSAVSDPQIERIALTLRDELAAGCPGGRLFGEHLASALAVHLLTCYAVHPARLKEYQQGLGKSDLSRVLAYIGDCLTDDLSLDDLAASVHLSPYHFARLFKQSTGQAPHRYVIAQRVEKAKSLLLTGGLTVGEVAQAVGFYDHAHFIRHFKRFTGVTPRAFRTR